MVAILFIIGIIVAAGVAISYALSLEFPKSTGCQGINCNQGRKACTCGCKLVD